MKKLFALKYFALFAALFMLVACDDDDPQQILIGSSIGILEKVDDASFCLNTDDGEKLLVENSADLISNKFVDGDRVQADFYVTKEFTKDDVYDYQVRILGCNRVLLKKPVALTALNAEEIGDDAVAVPYNWTTKDYLNFQIEFPTDGVVQHTINLVTVDDPIELEDGYLYFELRHNSKSDFGMSKYRGYVSFDSRDYVDTNTKGFVVRFRSLSDGEQYIKIKYDDGQEDITPMD